MIENRKLTNTKVGIYLLLFFAIWSVRELVIQPVFLNPLDNIFSELIGAAIKLLVWTLPAILLIRNIFVPLVLHMIWSLFVIMLLVLVI